MTTAWVRSPRVLWRRVADGVLLLAPGAAEPMIITGSGAAIWELLGSPMDAQDVAWRLAELFDTTAERTRAETAPFLAQLALAGVLTKVR